jgi:hypothetical protein
MLTMNPVHRAIAKGLKGEHLEDAERYRDQLPNFIIIGAAKSATTTLTTILPRSPDIFISRPKEPKFFGRRYDKGWDWYAKVFQKGKTYRLRGEASTMYASASASFQHTPELMHMHIPDLKLVYIVRHPLDRLVSQWRHYKGRHPDAKEFADLLKSRHMSGLLIGCSAYFERISAYRKFFPDSQIHCLIFEDLLANPSAVMEGLLRFLGADPDPAPMLDDGVLPRVNEAGDKGRAMVDKPVWPEELRAELTRQLKPDADQFLEYVGKPLDYWKW